MVDAGYVYRYSVDSTSSINYISAARWLFSFPFYSLSPLVALELQQVSTMHNVSYKYIQCVLMVTAYVYCRCVQPIGVRANYNEVYSFGVSFTASAKSASGDPNLYYVYITIILQRVRETKTESKGTKREGSEKETDAIRAMGKKREKRTRGAKKGPLRQLYSISRTKQGRLDSLFLCYFLRVLQRGQENKGSREGSQHVTFIFHYLFSSSRVRWQSFSTLYIIYTRMNMQERYLKTKLTYL